MNYTLIKILKYRQICYKYERDIIIILAYHYILLYSRLYPRPIVLVRALQMDLFPLAFTDTGGLGVLACGGGTFAFARLFAKSDMQFSSGMVTFNNAG